MPGEPQPSSQPPLQPIDLIPGDPLAALTRWVGDGAVDEAARSRARQRSLERQAAEEATMAGLLVDLAERARPVALTTAGGRRTRGPIVALGSDFAVVRESRLGDILVPLSSVTLVRPAPGDDAPVGNRPLNFRLGLADALVELATERPEVLVSVGSEELRGELRNTGTDLLALHLDGARRETVHVAIAALDYVVVLAR